MKASRKCRRYYRRFGVIGTASTEEQQAAYGAAGFVWIKKTEVVDLIKQNAEYQWTAGNPDNFMSMKQFCFVTMIL